MEFPSLTSQSQFKVVFLNKIFFCLSYVRKAGHLASRQTTYCPEWKLLEIETSDHEQSKKQFVSYTGGLPWCNLFLPGQKKLTPVCIGTASYFFLNAIRIKIQFKENQKTSKTREEATKENKNDVADGHKQGSEPLKNPERWSICSLHKKSWIFPAAHELGCVLDAFLEKNRKRITILTTGLKRMDKKYYWYHNKLDTL